MIDAHLHLNRLPPFAAAQACEHGVTGFLTTGTSPADWAETLALSAPDVKPFIGTHPWFADRHDQALLERLLIDNPAAGVGEIGLDAKAPPEQDAVFALQFALAAKLSRPAVIHCVKRFDRLKAFFKQTKLFPPAVLLHGFSGTAQDVAFFAKYPCFFSFSGRNPKPAVLTAVPADRLVAETDSPDQRPADDLCLDPAEKTNVPANLALILKKIEAITGIDENQITLNTERFKNAR